MSINQFEPTEENLLSLEKDECLFDTVMYKEFDAYSSELDNTLNKILNDTGKKFKLTVVRNPKKSQFFIWTE